MDNIEEIKKKMFESEAEAEQELAEKEEQLAREYEKFEQEKAIQPATVATNVPQVSNITAPNDFQANVSKGLNAVVAEAYANDEKFKQEITDTAKHSAQEYAELEKDRAELERQNVQYASELLETQQQLNQFQQADHKWDNQRSKRQFVYDGVKPIMQWVGIGEPMNIGLMVFLTILLTIPFIFGKPLQALIVGANPDDRKKQAQGYLWTLLALVLTALVIIAIVVPCKHFGVID